MLNAQVILVLILKEHVPTHLLSLLQSQRSLVLILLFHVCSLTAAVKKEKKKCASLQNSKISSSLRNCLKVIQQHQ